MNWDKAITDFTNYLRLERGMAVNTVKSYARDLKKVALIAIEQDWMNPLKLKLPELESLVKEAAAVGLNPRSQARLVSAIRSFYKFLVLEDEIENSPAELLEAPKLGRKLPDFLRKGAGGSSGGLT